MFKLVIQDDEGKTTVVPLIRDEITIGRKEGNTIRLTERNVSRRHARILRSNGEVQIEDLGSYNGIRVNNARIAERVSLRVSDQVQIGDYKLYLKAEGVEQVDDARTMPIERVDTAAATAATDVIGPAPTQPMGIPPTAGRLVGDPNRTLVSIADTDPQGRPVASAATVAALTSPVGYGKLVVLSSNFWGKEFELSRPSMMIGRTEENDIVLNHRSISRNHARLVREPETGRYTISDLQSSNGVRVNGQDYGKVELRRGDVIDLGHVRLRFVEPGEDFVFTRDAVMTDVPDVGGKRGVMVAVIVGVVVVAAIVTVILLKSGTKPEDGNTVQPGTQLDGSDSGTQVAIVEDAAAVTPPPVEIDAAASAVKPTDDDVALKNEVCLRFKGDQKWDDLLDCANQLAALGGKEAPGYKERANKEISAQPRIDELKDALDPKVMNLKKAKPALDAIQGSLYYDSWEKKYNAAKQAAIDELVGRLKRAVSQSQSCTTYNLLVRQANEAYGQGIGDTARRQVPCVPKVSPVDPCKDNPNAPGCTVTPPPACDFAEALAKGTDAYATNSFTQALIYFEKAVACKNDPGAIQRAFMAACKMTNRAKAKYYYKASPTAARAAMSICVGNGITEEELR